MKQSKPNPTPNPAVTATQAMRLIKVASCPTLSGKETLTYHIGSNAEAEVYLMVTSNTGGGFFSIEWVSLKAIQETLEQATQPLTSYALRNLYKGRSTNNPAFLTAALKHAGLVIANPEKPRCFDRVDAAAFMAEIAKLQAANVNIKVEVPASIKSPAIVADAS